MKKIVLLIFSGFILLTACRLSDGNAGQASLPPIVETTPATPSTPTPGPTTSSTPAQTSSEETPEPTFTPTPAVATNETTATSEPVATDTDTPSLETSTLPPLDSLSLRLNPVAGNFAQPLYVTHAGDGSNRLFVVEQPGRIRLIKNSETLPTPFLDIVPLVGSQANEQGLLSVAFHPDYANNGLFFVNYTNQAGDTTIARYQVSADPDVANPDSAKILLTISQPYRNHNGGQLVFGPDGYLYVGMGDGGAAGDPQNNGQSLDTLLGKILRLDVDNAEPYGVPPDNPFVNRTDARPEIWSYGWRNPWRISFDPATGDMIVADVGQNQYEEVHVEPAGAPGGLNYGWRLMEGRHCFDPPECDPASLDVQLPVAEYDHSQGCSITGGYVYRGAQFPDLTGTYFYGDYCSGIIWGLRRQADNSWSPTQLLSSSLTISSFGQDESGEVYVVNHRGEIFQIGN